MKEPHSFRVEAVVLRHSDWGEADRLITLFTREQGKIRAIAKGVRKIRSRKAGHLEPFTRVTLQLAKGHDLPIITQADTVNAYLPLVENLEKTGQASYIIELQDRFCHENEKEDTAVFNLLTDSLTRIASEADSWHAIRYFEMRLLDLQGFRPHLFKCADCGEEIKPVNQFFSPLAGGVLCPKCGLKWTGVWQISVEALKYLRHFQRSSYTEALKAHPSYEVRNEVEAILQRNFSYLLESKLNSPEFMKKIRESGK